MEGTVARYLNWCGNRSFVVLACTQLARIIVSCTTKGRCDSIYVSTGLARFDNPGKTVPLPQHAARPLSLSKPQVCEGPADRAANVRPPAASLGTVESALLPTPNCPKSLTPALARYKRTESARIASNPAPVVKQAMAAPCFRTPAPRLPLAIQAACMAAAASDGLEGMAARHSGWGLGTACVACSKPAFDTRPAAAMENGCSRGVYATAKGPRGQRNDWTLTPSNKLRQKAPAHMSAFRQCTPMQTSGRPPPQREGCSRKCCHHPADQLSCHLQ